MKLHRITKYRHKGNRFSSFIWKRERKYEQLLILRDIGKRGHLHTHNSLYIMTIESVSIDNEYEYENESISYSYSLSFL